MQNNHPTDIIVPVSSTSLSTTRLNHYTAQDEQGVHLRDYWRILIKRKWWFIGVFLSVVVVTLLVTLLMSPIYMVTVQLQILQDNPSALLGGSASDPLGALSGSDELDRFYETQYGILQSRSLAYALMDTLNLKEHPFYKQFEKDNPGDPPDVIRQKYADDLLLHLTVEPVKNSFLVNVSFKSTDKALAQKLPEAVQREYLKLSMSTRQQSYTMIRDWLDSELTRLGKKLEYSERSVYEDGQKTDFLSLEDGQFNVIIQKYIEVSRGLTAAQGDKAVKEALYRQIAEKGVDAPAITSHPLISSLRQQWIELQSQVSGSGKIFGNNYPDQQGLAARMKEVREHLDLEIKRIQTSVKADYEAASRAEQLLQKEYNEQKTKVIDLQNGLVQHHILTRDLQANQTLYEGLLARMKDASVASTMVSTNVSVINGAEVPYKPWLPKPLLFIVLSVIIGALGGAGTAFFVEYLDSSIKGTDELEKICHIPVLGVVPLADSKELESQGNHVDLITHNKPMSLVSEAVFHVRTALMLSASDAPPRVIVVTSANPSEGKSFISANIAVAMTGNERKCLIMDCDLRKPRLHRVFEQSNKRGLTNYLTGNASLEEVIRPTVVPNLYFIPAGPTPPNPSELFSSAAFKTLLDQLREDYHHIILDSPPVIGFADARSLASNADGVVFVFKHHSTTVDAGRLAVQLIAQNNCRILGGVLSMARRDLMGYGAYYGYYKTYHKAYKGYGESSKTDETEED